MAKEIPHIAIRVEDIKSELTRNGANVEAVRNQVELAWIPTLGDRLNTTAIIRRRA